MEAAAHPLIDEPGLQADQRTLDRGWLRIGAGVAVAAQAMVFSFAINLSEVGGWAYVIVHGILISAAFAALVLLGGDLVRSAWAAAHERRVSIDLLFLVTLGGALVGSLVSTLTRTGSVYYEVVAVLIVVHTAGKMLGARSRVAALRAVEETREKFEWCDLVRDDGSVARVRAREVEAGGRVRVAPGAGFAVDGEILSGRGYVQEASMTGEWRPVSRGLGDRVWAGTFSVDGSFEVRAEGGARKIDRILGLVEQARLAPSQLQREADSLMAWFLPLVVAASLATFGLWWVRGPWDRALFNAMAVLLVACPCAMGLATPVAIWSALARLSRIGLVARTADVIDVLARADVLCIDKTGTLSTDALAVRAWSCEPGYCARQRWLKSAVVAAEEGLAHPVAQALRATFPAEEPVKVLSRRIEPGSGVVATVSCEGREVELAVGERVLGGVAGERAREERGKAVYVFCGGALVATIELEEKWRLGLRECFSLVNALGLHVEVLSGDPLAESGLGQAGTESGSGCVVRGGLTPGQKHERVASLVAEGRVVVFVGDGLNDAAAMSASHVSIAMSGGTELARASAGAVFVGEDLRFLPHAISVARAARKSVRLNLFFAAGYNGVGVILAALGWLHPVVAALLMVGSSAFVSVYALRAGR